jgi:integrase
MSVTFSQQSEIWLDSLRTRKRKPVSPATLHAFGSYVRRLAPMIGDMKLAEVNNGTLKQLVQQLDKEKLSAKTINELVSVVKSVVGSLADESTGEPLLKRDWSARFIDAPTVAKQKQPCVTAGDIERCLRESSSDQERLLYTVVAGTGLRIAEALAIHVSGKCDHTSWSPDGSTISVRSSVFNGREIGRLKTVAAKRTVDLDPRLNDFIGHYAESKGIKVGDYLFQARRDGPMHVNTARHWLADHGIPGFHAFRRFRITRLRECAVPEDILRFWVGHSGQSITDTYSKLGECDDLRKEWATRAELGFVLPEISKPGDPPPSSPYQASDDDLPVELFESPIEMLADAK